MSTINFPASPSLNDEFLFQGRTWVYNGSGWRAKTGTLGVVSTGAAGLQPATGFGTIVYAVQVTLDLAVLAGQVNKITLTGSLELAATNLALGRSTGLLLNPGASQRTITFPVDWKPVGAKPASIPANKIARLSLECWGTSASDVVFAIAIQP
jgi:hypothetical protein